MLYVFYKQQIYRPSLFERTTKSTAFLKTLLVRKMLEIMRATVTNIQKYTFEYKPQRATEAITKFFIV